MKVILISAFFAIFSFNLIAQSRHIQQSKPFKKVLRSIKTNAPNLFMKSFSNEIMKLFNNEMTNGEDDETLWESRLKEAKGKFENRFGAFEVHDFSYKFEKEDAQLIIYFKGKEQFKMRVVKEGCVWKLDEN